VLYLYYIMQAIGVSGKQSVRVRCVFTLPRLDVFFLFNIISCPQHNHNIILLYSCVAVKSRRTRHNNGNIPPPPPLSRTILFLASIIIICGRVCCSARCTTIVHCVHNNFIITYVVFQPDIMRYFADISRTFRVLL